eukprot:gene11214-12506_t
MFSPVGKKKILLQQKFARGDDSGHRALSPSSSPTRGHGTESSRHSPTRSSFGGASVSSRSTSPSERASRGKVKIPPSSASQVAATGALERALSDPGMLGIVMRKILQATTNYRPHRDAILLKAFESKVLEYQFFRLNLNTAFWLSFSDEEFQTVVDYFDPSKAGLIDGYAFMIAFTRLAAIRKDHEAQLVREKQEEFLKNKEAEEERELIEIEKRNDLAVDYHFSEGVRKTALKKLELAAKNFDPYHPSSPSTAAFDVKFIKPAAFKEMLKLTFNLKVDRAELGAILKEFCEEEVQQVPSSDFMKFFFRVGYLAREEEKKHQRSKQALLDKKAEEEREKKMLEAKNKMQLKVDYNFTPDDETTAMEKLRAASEKYDKNATGSVSLEGFDCEELSPGDFRELLKRVFNIVLTNAELGFVMQKYDIKKTGNLHCKTFLTEMLQLGRESRHKAHLDQLQKQRKLLEQAEKEHQDKILAVQKDERVPINSQYSDEDLQSALTKLTDAAVKFEKGRGGTLESFETSHLDLVQFKRGLKRTFNLTYSGSEMGALLDYLEVGADKMIDCHKFLTTFTTLGANERYRIRAEQLKSQRDATKAAKEEHERKIQANLNRSMYDVDFEFSDQDRDESLRKMIESATKFDSTHPAALGLQAFEKKSMLGPEFKEIVRRTFQLQLTAKEVGALFKYFEVRARTRGTPTLPFDQIDCGEFLKFFLQVGVTERANLHRQQLEKQRKENEEREREHRKKVEDLANRQTYQPDLTYTSEDKASIMAKLLIASEKFDRSHPAAPSLEAFDAAYMPPGVFRENIKAIFGVKATPKEIGYLLELYDKDKSGNINTKDFLIQFFAMGKEARDTKRREALEKQRETTKFLKKEAEEKLLQLTEKTDYAIDPLFTSEDFYEAERRMIIASEKYDKTHPSAPNLEGFNGPLSPGAFRELLKRAFSIYLNPKEVGSILQRFHMENDLNTLDGKKFIIYFIKLGFDERARRKARVLAEQRQTTAQMKVEQEKKLLQASQKTEIELVEHFSEQDRENAMKKLINASALYDKNAPGCVSLDSFHAKYLTPGVFREVVKRTFNVLWNAEELAAMVEEFSNGRGNVDTNKFLIAFIKMGAEERERRKAIQLEKQRRQDMIREAQEKIKLKKAEEKVALKINYIYSDEEKAQAFEKLAIAAKKYDKAHPAAMSLQGFEQKTMKPHVFREMLKRTFNFLPSPGELGALMHYFDQKNTGEVSSYKFLIHFLKLGISERDKEHKESLKKLREDEAFRERYHQEKMAAQWAKADLNVTYDFSEAEQASAMEKLGEAAQKFDPASPGPMGLTAFQASVLSPAVFREMLKRCFNMKLTNGELAALISAFDRDGSKRISCADFMVKFTNLGSERRNAVRLAQIEKQRKMNESARIEAEEKQRKADSKMEVDLDDNFTDEDFNNVLNKIRLLASNYDRSHPSAPSLRGFIGTDMKPNEFKQMMMRTFSCNITSKELAALVAFFPSKTNVDQGPGAESRPSTAMTDASSMTRSLSPPRRSPGLAYDGVPRISNRAFLAYFNKIQREEQAKRHKQRIARDRDFVEAKKAQEEEEVRKAKQTLEELLLFTNEDENNCLVKLKQAAKEYATDSAPFQDALQGFKGPALPPDKFRDLFCQVFQIKFSFPEMGFLLSMLDHSGLRVFDGSRFLRWFYKLARIQEKFLLGESDEEVTLDGMRYAATLPVSSTRVSFSGSVVSMASSKSSHRSSSKRSYRSYQGPRTASTQRTHSRESDESSRLHRTTASPDSKREGNGSTKDPFAEAFGFSQDWDGPNEDEKDANALASIESAVNNVNAFSQATLSKAWLLPSIATSLPPTASDPSAITTNENFQLFLHDLFAPSDPSRDLQSLHGSASNHQVDVDLPTRRLSSISSSIQSTASLHEFESRQADLRLVLRTSESAYSKKLKSLNAYGRVQTAAPRTTTTNKSMAGMTMNLSKTMPASLKKMNRSVSPSRSLSSERSSHAKIASSASSITTTSNSDYVDDKHFLTAIFADPSQEGLPITNHANNNKRKILDPVAHLLNLKNGWKVPPGRNQNNPNNSYKQRPVLPKTSKVQRLKPIASRKEENDKSKADAVAVSAANESLEDSKGLYFFPVLPVLLPPQDDVEGEEEGDGLDHVVLQRKNNESNAVVDQDDLKKILF